MHRRIVLFLFFSVSLALIPLSVSAHQARFVEVGQHDITTVKNPDVSQAFYGQLEDFPHMFEIQSDETFNLYTEILVPDIENQPNDIGVLILKVEERGVTEIKRLSPKEAEWESRYEWFGGDSYRRGSSFFDSLDAGTYQIEVSTPVNLGKYVLVVGKKEEFSIFDYVDTVRDIARVKSFFGKPAIAILGTPFVYAPLILLFISLSILYRSHRRKGRV